MKITAFVVTFSKPCLMHFLRTLFLFLCLVCRVGSMAQTRGAVWDAVNSQQFMTDANGRPVYMRTAYDIEGTPFYHPDYCITNIKVRKGKTYAGIKAKINLQNNRIFFDAGDGKEMETAMPIERIEFMQCSDSSKNKVLVSGYPAADDLGGERFYVLLDSGRISLLKYIQVLYHDTRDYGRASITRVFTQEEMYYVYEPGTGMKKLPAGKKSILAVFPAHQQALSQFVTSHDLKCRKEQDLRKVVAYYNSLN